MAGTLRRTGYRSKVSGVRCQESGVISWEPPLKHEARPDIAPLMRDAGQWGAANIELRNKFESPKH